MRDSQDSAGVGHTARNPLAGAARSSPPLLNHRMTAESPASLGVTRQLPPLTKLEIPSHTPERRADVFAHPPVHRTSPKSLMTEGPSEDPLSQYPSASTVGDTGPQTGKASPPRPRHESLNNGPIKLPPYTALERSLNESLNDEACLRRASFTEKEYRRSPEEFKPIGEELDFPRPSRPLYSRSRDSHFSPEMHPYARVSAADARPQSLRHLRSWYGSPSDSKLRSDLNGVSQPYPKSTYPPYDRQKMSDTWRPSYYDDRDMMGAYAYNLPRHHSSSGAYGYPGAFVNGAYQAWQHAPYAAAYENASEVKSSRDAASAHESDSRLQHAYSPNDPFSKKQQFNDTMGASKNCASDSAGEGDISTGSVKSVSNGSASGQLRRRGKLPKHITEHLKSWLMSHTEHPYPTEEEKHEFCAVTSLDINQISNWFVNARRRILNTNVSSSNGGTANS